MAQYRKDTQVYDGQSTRHEVMMIADKFGNIITPFGFSSASFASADAFGRIRAGLPFTLFDSQHRYQINTDKWNYTNTASSSYAHSLYESVVNLVVETAQNAEVVAETKRVFAYQPGKSLQALMTFTMSPGKTNLRQRVGYFGANNGVYLERDGTTAYMVRRDYTSGTLVEKRVAQSNWNIDPLDGSGQSLLTLNLDKSQILFMDFEWLGVGSVRTGFVIDGSFYVAHIFNHANANTSTYMTTACLPIRYEIKNTGVTASTSTLKQICSTVISEGGYEAVGVNRTVATANIASGISVGTSYVNIATIRLKSNHLDSIVIPTGLDILNISNVDFEYILCLNAAFTTPLVYASATNAVEANTAGGTVLTSTGTVLERGYLGGKTTPFSLSDGFNWDYQLGRTLGGVSDTVTLAVRAGSAAKAAAGTLKFVEIV